ncbi:hypothetical protein J6590_018547 [Homalodisca vitripennis]|nr:hypothetical protein J6590_018547 [Homalodisca vitripennis]
MCTVVQWNIGGPRSGFRQSGSTFGDELDSPVLTQKPKRSTFGDELAANSSIDGPRSGCRQSGSTFGDELAAPVLVAQEVDAVKAGQHSVTSWLLQYWWPKKWMPSKRINILRRAGCSSIGGPRSGCRQSGST